MDIQAAKIELIHWLTELQNPEILKQINAIKESTDWWDEISKEERAEIEKGLEQADNGEVIPHDEVMAKYKKWL